jgi:hypothetical protein
MEKKTRKTKNKRISASGVRDFFCTNEVEKTMPCSRGKRTYFVSKKPKKNKKNLIVRDLFCTNEVEKTLSKSRTI